MDKEIQKTKNWYSRRFKKVDSPRISGDTAYLKAGYEGNQISYSDGTFSGAEVLGATMTGTYGVVGNPSYDEEAFRLIIETAKLILHHNLKIKREQSTYNCSQRIKNT